MCRWMETQRLYEQSEANVLGAGLEEDSSYLRSAVSVAQIRGGDVGKLARSLSGYLQVNSGSSVAHSQSSSCPELALLNAAGGRKEGRKGGRHKRVQNCLSTIQIGEKTEKRKDPERGVRRVSICPWSVHGCEARHLLAMQCPAKPLTETSTRTCATKLLTAEPCRWM